MTDAPRSDRPVTIKVDKIIAEAEWDQRASSYDIAKELTIDHQILLNYLKKLGTKESSM